MTRVLARRRLLFMTTTEHPPVAPVTVTTTTQRSAMERPDIAPLMPTTPPAATDIPAPIHPAADSSIWTASRVVALALTVIETVLLTRFALLLLGANPSHPLVAFVYGITAPIVRPFQGIFGQPDGPNTVDLAAVLAVVFFLLVGALIVAGVRAATGRSVGPKPVG